MVDVDRGKRDGAALSRELEGRDSSGSGGEYRPVSANPGDIDEEELENRHED